MKERPILMSAPMVRATLREVDPKTQTRRIIRLPKIITPEDGDSDAVTIAWSDNGHAGPGFYGYLTEYPEEGAELIRCPYGQSGDRLWVRETWVSLLHTSPATDEPHAHPGDKIIEHATRRANGKGWNYDGKVIAYRATSDVEFCDGDGFSGEMANRDDMPCWKPSIHMPRAYSRIDLEVVSVRAERLQEISQEDALAEGVDPTSNSGNSAVAAFFHLWCDINGAPSWDANPWVWVVEFKRVAP